MFVVAGYVTYVHVYVTNDGGGVLARWGGGLLVAAAVASPPLQGFTLAAQQLLADLREHRLLELLLKEGFVPADHSVAVRSPPA